MSEQHDSDKGQPQAKYTYQTGSAQLPSNHPAQPARPAFGQNSVLNGPAPRNDQNIFNVPNPNRSAQPAGPAFGQTSVLNGPPSRNDQNIFNISKPNRVRPEHHRVDHWRPPPQVGPSATQSTASGTSAAWRDPYAPRTNPVPSRDSSPDVVEITGPVNPRSFASYPAPPKMYSSLPPKQPASNISRASGSQGIHINLTDRSYERPDLSDYVDQAKANADIKALLEGGFEDEDDKPKTRSRKKKLEQKANELGEQMKALSVTPDGEQSQENENEEEDDEEEDDGTVEGLKVKLLPHQREGVDWMVGKELGKTKIKGSPPKGGILADDMGLGKTIQSIALVLSNKRPPLQTFTGGKADKDKLSNRVGKGTLVVAPLALIKQWESEINTKVEASDRLKVLVHHGPARTKQSSDLKKYDVVITTYQILVSEHGSCKEGPEGYFFGCFDVHWYRVILDEAHTIKNKSAKATKACFALRSEYRWCLTGTPMQNNLDELQSLIKFLQIKPYNEVGVWKEQIMRPLNQGRGGLAMRRLQAVLKVFMKRRTKEVLKAEGALNPGGKVGLDASEGTGFKITERRIEKVEAKFSPEELHFYKNLEQRADESIERMMGASKVSYASALTLLLRLRQACNHSELVAKAHDKEALTTGQVPGSSTPRKKSAVEDDVDDIANMLGGLSVKTKQCDVCLKKLTKDEIDDGSIRCSACEKDIQDLRGARADNKQKKKKDKKNKGRKHEPSKQDAKKSRRQAHRVLEDSDEEEDQEGSWIVPEEQRGNLKLGKAGGSDDENAEGGGEWLESEDSETGNESSIVDLGSHRKKVISLNTSEEGSGSDQDEAEDQGSENASDDSEDSDSDSHDPDDSDDADLATLSELAASTKVKKLVQILHKETPKHKVIVFSQFTSMLDIIEPFLRGECLKFTRYDGGMRNDLREASLTKLREDPGTRILLCSLKCGSLGLNLTAASRVVILEPFWNPFVEEQAIDRVHRLNQTVDVTVYKITIKDTVEQRILELQEKKRTLAAAAIEGKAVAKLGIEELLGLFRREAEFDDRHEKDHRGLSAKVSVLNGDNISSGYNIERDDGSSRQSGRQGQRKVTPTARKEHETFGRRW